jgi:hypothetical protein
MRAAGAILGLVIALAIGYYIVKSEYVQGPTGGAPPKEVIDVVGVKNDLLAIGQAERMYLASHGSYASVDQLQQDGAITFSGTNRRGYNYVAEVDDGQHFRITATPSDPAKQGWPTLTVDDTMQISQP